MNASNRTRRRRSVAANYLTLFASHATKLLLSLAFVTLVARYLGVAEFGVFSYGIAFAEIFYIAADFGIPTILTREIAGSEGNADTYYSTAVVMQMTLGTAAVAFIALATIIERAPSAQQAVTLIMGAVVFLNVLTKNSQAVFRAFERMEFDALVQILERVFTFAAVLIVVTGHGSMKQIAVAYLLGPLIAAVSAFATVQSRFVRFRTSSIRLSSAKTLFARSSPLVIASLGSVLKDRTGFVLLKHLSGDAAVGTFSAGYRLVIPCLGFASLLGIALMPAFSRCAAVARDQLLPLYRQWIKLAFVAGLLGQVFLLTFAKDVVQLLLGEMYTDSIGVVTILSIALPCSLSYFVATTALVATHAMRALVISMFAAGATNLTVGYFAIPHLGAPGAAIASASAEIVLLCVSVYLVDRHLAGRFNPQVVLKPLAIAAVTYAALLVTRHSPPGVTLCAGAVTVVVSSMFLQFLSMSEVRAMVTFVRVQQEQNPRLTEEVPSRTF